MLMDVSRTVFSKDKHMVDSWPRHKGKATLNGGTTKRYDLSPRPAVAKTRLASGKYCPFAMRGAENTPSKSKHVSRY